MGRYDKLNETHAKEAAKAAERELSYDQVDVQKQGYDDEQLFYFRLKQQDPSKWSNADKEWMAEFEANLTSMPAGRKEAYSKSREQLDLHQRLSELAKNKTQ